MIALVVLACSLPGVAAAPDRRQVSRTDGIAALLQKVERSLESGQPSRYMELLSGGADRDRALVFAQVVIVPGITRAVVRERDREPLFGALPGDGYRLLVEVFTEFGSESRLATWRLDVRRRPPADAQETISDEWVISGQELLSVLRGLHRLALDPTRQFAARNLIIHAEDLELTLAEGSVFIAEADGRTTALVLLGKGEMVFSPTPETEKGQIQIAAGSETLQTPFDAAYLRAASFDLNGLLAQGALVERPVDQREFRRADEVFRVEAAKSFVIDLGDLSTETWSLSPGFGDVLAEIRTRRFDTLTYARSSGDAEDISLFDRRRRKNLSVYASRAKQEKLGSAYNEDLLADFDVLHYAVATSFTPDRRWIEGQTTLRIRILAPQVTSISLKLAEPLAVRSVVAGEFGRLLAVRVRNQSSVVVNFPVPISRGVELSVTVAYEGRLMPQPTDREIVRLDQLPDVEAEPPAIPLEEAFLYSTRSYWYAQASASDYATATLRLTVPAGYTAVGSGTLVDAVPLPASPGSNIKAPSMVFTYAADQPVRYLSCLVTKLVAVRSQTVRMGDVVGGKVVERPPGVFFDSLELSVLAHARQQSRARQLVPRVVEILRFFSSIVGDFGYPSLTLAVVETELPGGHSPPFMAVLNQPAPGSQKVWRNDPASFEDFPEFFLAHELAHQWWGHAVGWRNYHEQWLSEGMAQYLAALYAERARGRAVFESLLRRMRRWAMDESDQGPIWLGYRIGHIKNDSRLFRAVVYNKSAVVLHMLRRLVGDDVFFRSLRRFYYSSRYRKVGTTDLQRAFEAETLFPLDRFFDRWVRGATIPQVKVSTQIEEGKNGGLAVVQLEQTGEVFDLPLTVTVDYVDRPPFTVEIRLTDQTAELRIPLIGSLRRIDVNRDELSIVDVVRQSP